MIFVSIKQIHDITDIPIKCEVYEYESQIKPVF